jgi:hypothetical protein
MEKLGRPTGSFSHPARNSPIVAFPVIFAPDQGDSKSASSASRAVALAAS